MGDTKHVTTDHDSNTCQPSDEAMQCMILSVCASKLRRSSLDQGSCTNHDN